MEDLLLPSVVASAVALERTPLLVLANEVACLPLLTYLKWVVGEQLRLPPEVLPVVSVDALRFVVLSVEGAPLSLEIEHVEFLVAGHLVNQRRLYLKVGVGEAAELLVVALLQSLGAELGLVLLDVVQPLYFVVGVLAMHVVAILVGTEFDSVGDQAGAATSVGRPVMLGTALRVVRLLNLAGLCLEVL